MHAPKPISEFHCNANHKLMAEQILLKIEGYLIANENNDNFAVNIRYAEDGGIQIRLGNKSDYEDMTVTETVKSDAPKLTRRETDVIKLIAKGLSYNEISQVLVMSAHTVTTHIKNIYKKLSVHSRGEAAFEAMQLGLLN